MIIVISGSDNMLRLIGLVDKSVAPGATPTEVTDATVTGEIKEGSVVIVGSLTFASISSSNDYEVLLTDVNSLLMTLEKNYDLVVEADDGANRKRVFTESIRAIK